MKSLKSRGMDKNRAISPERIWRGIDRRIREGRKRTKIEKYRYAASELSHEDLEDEEMIRQFL